MTGRTSRSAARSFHFSPAWVAPVVYLACLCGGTTGYARSVWTSSDDASWTWNPQPVDIAIETDGDPSLSAGLVRTVRETIEGEVRAKFGPAWKTSFVDQFSEEAYDDQFDVKRIRVLLARSEGRYVIETLEYDAGLRSTGPLVRRTVRQREMVGRVAAEATLSAYRPKASIGEVRGDQAVLRLRGESLLPNETRAELAGRGEGFLPFLRRRDSGGGISSVARVPWTVLSIRDGGATPLAGTITSGIRSPLASRRRGRVEALALAAGEPSGETAVTITAGTGGEPLRGVAVYETVAGGPSTLLGATDDRGRITLTADGDRVRTLVVAGRYLPLARLPLIAGLDAEVTAAVPVDARLLEAERKLANLQSEFTDRLVLRRVLALTAATQLERGDKATAAATLARLGQVGSVADFADSLEARRRLMDLGSSTSDRLIDRLYGEALAAMRAVDDRQALAELQKRLAEAN